MKHPIALIFSLALFSTVSITASASESQWVVVGDDDAGSFALKRGSFEYNNNTKGDRIATMVAKHLHKKTNKVSFLRFYVTTDQCESGEGYLIAVKAPSGEYAFNSAWMSGGGNIASDIAEILCGTHQSRQDGNSLFKEL